MQQFPQNRNQISTVQFSNLFGVRTLDKLQYYLAGYVQKEEGLFGIVDDVLATGRSMETAIEAVNNGKRKIRLVSVISYGMDELIAKKYNIEVISLYTVDDILKVIPQELAELLTVHVENFKTRLKEIL